MTQLEAWFAIVGVAIVIVAKVAIIIHLVRQTGPDRFGALILAAVLGFGLVSVVAGVILWLVFYYQI